MLGKILLSKLIDAGHDVETVDTKGLRGKPDTIVFQSAITDQRVLMTHNCADFLQLAKNGSHPGVLLVYQFNKPNKEMTYDQIVKAIANLEQTGTTIPNAPHVLNSYNY